MQLALGAVNTNPIVPSTFAAPMESCQRCPARDLGVCGAMPASGLSRLTANMARMRLAPGQTFVGEGEPASHVFTVAEGMVRLYKLLPDGRRQIVGFLLPDDFIGLGCGDTYGYSAEAITPVRTCRFPRRAFEALLELYPAAQRRLLALASNELAAAQEQMMLLGRKTARERVASFLLMLSRRLRSSRSIVLPMTRADIADYLGLTIETVSRTITLLRKAGPIALDSADRLRLVSPDALEALAGGGH
jgi:CRP/FNR family transcriptional regulator